MAFGNREELQYKLNEGTNELRAFVTNTIIKEGHEVDRIMRYEMYFNFYKGRHWRQFNDGFIAFNYCKAFVDKISMFLLGKTGFTFQVKALDNDVISPELEESAEKLILKHWRKNKIVSLGYSMLQMGSVTGDLFMFVGWNNEGKHAEIKVLDSRQCFPTFKNGDTSKLESFIIRTPLTQNDNEYKLFVTKYTEDKIESWYQKDTTLKPDFRFEGANVKNTYGIIPIVHIKNKPTSEGYYSTSDLNDILKLNKVYNELAQELKGIIDYHVTPTTVITGGTAKSLKKGLGNIWSGLPSEANVFNLGLDADLSASVDYMKMIKTGMHELSDVPENALGKLQAISNTSAAALQLTFQPLIHQADMKWIMYGEGISEINKIILSYVEKFDPKEANYVAMGGAGFGEKYIVDPVFSYGFPQDRMQELQQAEMELRMKIASRKEVMNRLGKNNVPNLMEEIEEDAIRLAKLTELESGISDDNQEGAK